MNVENIHKRSFLEIFLTNCVLRKSYSDHNRRRSCMCKAQVMVSLLNEPLWDSGQSSKENVSHQYWLDAHTDAKVVLL